MKYSEEVFNQLGIVAWKDKDGVFLGMNQMALDSLGLKIEDVVGKRDEDFFPKELVEEYRKVDMEVMASGKVKHLAEEVPDKAGNLMKLTVVKSPLKDQKGEVVGIIVLASSEG